MTQREDVPFPSSDTKRRCPFSFSCLLGFLPLFLVGCGVFCFSKGDHVLFIMYPKIRPISPTRRTYMNGIPPPLSLLLLSRFNCSCKFYMFFCLLSERRLDWVMVRSRNLNQNFTRDHRSNS